MTTNGKVGTLVTQNGALGQDVIDTPGKIVLWQAAGTVYSAIDVDLTNYRLVAKVPGVYQVICSITFEGEVGDVYYLHIYKNGAPTAYSAGTIADTGGAPYNLNVFGGVIMAEGDYVEAYIESDDPAGSDFVLVHGQFGILSI